MGSGGSGHSEADLPLAFHSEPPLWIWTDGCRSHGDGGREVDNCSSAARVCGKHGPANQVMLAACQQPDNAQNEASASAIEHESQKLLQFLV